MGAETQTASRAFPTRGFREEDEAFHRRESHGMDRCEMKSHGNLKPLIVSAVAFLLLFLVHFKSPTLFGVLGNGGDTGRFPWTGVHARLVWRADKQALKGAACRDGNENGRALFHFGIALILLPIDDVTVPRLRAYWRQTKRTAARLW